DAVADPGLDDDDAARHRRDDLVASRALAGVPGVCRRTFETATATPGVMDVDELAMHEHAQASRHAVVTGIQPAVLDGGRFNAGIDVVATQTVIAIGTMCLDGV